MSLGGLPILTYHTIDTSGSVIATDPSWFAETMAILHEGGFRAVDLASWVADGRPEVERGFALTFDDGLRSILGVAPILAYFGFVATAFLVADRMGGDNAWPGQLASVPRSRLLDWSDLIGLRAAGYSFGSHTRTHPRLDRCDPATRADELRGSRDAIEARTGSPCPLLAYPYGVAPPRVRHEAARFFSASFGTRLDVSRPDEDGFALSRIDASYLRTPRALDRLLSGRARFGVRRTLRGARRAVRSVVTAGG
jgi:peptidoglycan/xylan/chitin deacetylase (PgdA/CDA1 family)